jgi:hypothetical protein
MVCHFFCATSERIYARTRVLLSSRKFHALPTVELVNLYPPYSGAIKAGNTRALQKKVDHTIRTFCV